MRGYRIKKKARVTPLADPQPPDTDKTRTPVSPIDPITDSAQSLLEDFKYNIFRQWKFSTVAKEIKRAGIKLYWQALDKQLSKQKRLEAVTDMAMLCEANCNELSLEEELLEFDEIERQAMEWQANIMKMHKELQRQSAATGQVLGYELNWGPKYGLGRPILVHPDDLSTEDTQVRTSKAKRLAARQLLRGLRSSSLRRTGPRCQQAAAALLALEPCVHVCRAGVRVK